MNIDKVIEILDSGKAPETEQDFEDFDTAIETAINLLKTHPDNQPNDPLTLEELREMDGEPVWISYFAGGPNVCMLVDAKHDVCRDAHGGFAVFENLGRTWLAYRRKPEGNV